MTEFVRKHIATGIALCVAALIFGYWHFFIQVETFSDSTWNIPEARDTAEVVELSDGDEFSLEASYVVKNIGNRRVRMIAYNGSVPGPFIKVVQGGSITIHFTNNLDIETTVHSHGLRLDFPFDGTPGVSQKAVQPGETFTYQLKFPDAGTYWYHPHVREDYAQELGLYGNYQVEPVDYTLGPVNEEVNLIVDDILFEDDDIPPFFRNKTNFAIMGRFGNVMLVNGETDYTKEFLKGSVVRLNITNVANARPFDLTIEGAKMKLVGSDLSPYEREEFIENLIVSPSERYIVDVYFEKSGTYTFMHTSHDVALGDIEYPLGTFVVSDEAIDTSYANDFNRLQAYGWVSDDARKFDSFLYRKPDRTIRLTMDPGELNLAAAMESMPCHKMPDGTWMGDCTEEAKEQWLAGLTPSEISLGGEEIHWEDHTYDLNKRTTNEDITWQIVDADTHNANESIDWKYNVGDVIKMRVFNDPMSPHPMQHPFHIHGQRMMTIAIDGRKVENNVWKDSIMIPVGATYDIIVEFSNPGIWMAHCHIAEHLSAGMMFNVAVGEEYFEMYDELVGVPHGASHR